MSGGRPQRRSVWMRRAGHTLAGGVALAVLLLVTPRASAAFKYLKVGMEVPEFALKTLDGKEHTLAEVKTAPATLVVFWATWSPRSQPALEDAQKLLAQYEGKGFRVLAVNVNRVALGPEDRSQIGDTQSRLKLTMPIVVDAGLETYNAFGVVATPSTAVLNAEGKIVHEAASYLRATGDEIREAVEILLGVREAPKVEAVAAKPAYKPERKVLLNYNLGRTLLARGTKEKAMVKLEEAAAADSKFPGPHLLLGHLLLVRKKGDDVEKAAAHFRIAAEAEPENVSACTGLGEALLEMGKIDEAAAQFDRAVSLDPTYTPAVAGQALLLAKKGKSDEAEARFKSALELNPLDAGTYLRRGEGREAGGNLKGAAASYRRAIEILMNMRSSGDEA